MGTSAPRGHLHLQRTVMFLVALTIQPQATLAVGMFELQIRHFQNPHGLLQNGACCDLAANGGQRCSARDQCDTYFQACLKEYQARVVPTGPCTFGTGSTGVLGGNSHSHRHQSHSGAEDSANGHIVIPFKYAWPVSMGLSELSLRLPREPARLQVKRYSHLRIPQNNNGTQTNMVYIYSDSKAFDDRL